MFFLRRYRLPYLSSPSSALSDRSPFSCSPRKSEEEKNSRFLPLRFKRADLRLDLTAANICISLSVSPRSDDPVFDAAASHIHELIPRLYNKKKKERNQSRLNQLDLTVILTRFGSEWSKVPSCLTCTTPASVNNTCNFNWNHLVAWNGMNRALLPTWQLPEPGRRSCWDLRGDIMIPWSCSLQHVATYQILKNTDCISRGI